jgi:predicted XRE-type DNA-binding protein
MDNHKTPATQVPQGADAAAFFPEGLGQLHVKALLAKQICTLIRELPMSQTQAATLVGLPQPRLSSLLRGHCDGVSESKMLGILNRLGHDVQIVIGGSRKEVGSTSVICS